MQALGAASLLGGYFEQLKDFLVRMVKIFEKK